MSAPLQFLLEGNREFARGTAERCLPPRNEACESVAAPVTIISCSDAPWSPDLVFRRSAGEIFVLTAAGNVVEVQVGGSLDYAVTVLGSRLVIVLGHSACGVVAAALSSSISRAAGSQALAHLPLPLRQIVSAIPDLGRGMDPASRLERSIEANVRFGVTRIRRCGGFAERVEQGELAVVGAVLDGSTRTVRLLD